MNFETWLSIFGALVAAASVVFVFVNGRRANANAEKKLTVEEKQALHDREDVIARRRREELDRLYARCDELEADITELKTDRRTHRAQIAALNNRLAVSDMRENLIYRHTKALRDHIINQLPPPPPTMPQELIDWYEELEATDPGTRPLY